MKVVDDLINKISTMNLKTVSRKSEEVKIIEAHLSHAKPAKEEIRCEPKIDGEYCALGVYDNSLGHAIAPKITAVTSTQRREVQSWSLGRYQAITESTTELPILNYGSETEFKTLNGNNARHVRSSQYGMTAMSWGIKEQVLNTYALTASEELSKRNAEYYSNSHSLAEQAAAEFGDADIIADDCDDIEEDCNNSKSVSFDGTVESVDFSPICSTADDSGTGIHCENAVSAAPKSAEILDFYRNQQACSTSSPVLEDESALNEVAHSIDELEASLSESDLSELSSYEFDAVQRPGMDQEPALLTLERYEPKAKTQANLRDWDESISFSQLHPGEFVCDEFSSIDIERTDVNKLIELAQRADTPGEVLERIARSAIFDVRWPLQGTRAHR